MNLSFLSTGFLYLLPLSLLPIVIHLFFRRKPKHIKFSYLKFIKLAANNVTPRKKLQQWLLLLIRCLILLFLGLAFAKPIGYIGGVKQENKNKNIFILIDTSYSMSLNSSGQSTFNSSKDLAISIIDKLIPPKQRAINKQIGVILFSNYVEQYTGLTNDTEYLKKFILQAQQSYNPTDLVPAFKYAYELFYEQPDTNRAIIVITDMAKHIVAEDNALISDGVEKYNSNIQVIFVDAQNNTVDNIAAEKTTLLEEPLRLNVDIENFSGSQQLIPVNLSIRDKKVCDSTVRLDPKKVTSYEINFTEKQQDEIYGNVTIQEDALNIDDACYFVYPIKTQKRVLVVDGDPKFGFGVNSESYYVNTSLSGIENDRFSVKVCNLQEFEDENEIDKYDSLILCNLEEISEKSVGLIAKFSDASRQKTVLLFLGDKVNPENYPGLLNENIGTIQESQMYIADYKNAVNLFKDIDNFELDKVKVTKYFKLNTSFSNVLLQLDNGDPLLIEKTMNNSKLFIFASTADREWTNMPSKPFFPYFIRSIIESTSLVADKKESYIFNAGQPIKFTPEFSFTSAVFMLPGGETAPAKITPKAPLREISLDKTQKPGIYELQLFSNSGKVSKYFAVNLQNISLESSLEKIDTGKLNKKFPKTRVSFLKADKDVQQKIFTIIEGKELSKEFFILILVLLLLEVILANIRI
ncbi:MAG: VWA domain-containing protein [Elusimicrobia bacterium]|nr:VWA domain-containing protein [Elusimicrobiota bacterium]